MWHALVTRLALQIETLATICRFNPAILPRPKNAATGEKILFNGTREELGGFLKFLSELGIIDCPNTSMVARVGSRCFSTHRQAEISPEGLRNDINASGPLEIEDINAWLCKFMQNYREKRGGKELKQSLSINR